MSQGHIKLKPKNRQSGVSASSGMKFLDIGVPRRSLIVRLKFANPDRLEKSLSASPQAGNPRRKQPLESHPTPAVPLSQAVKRKAPSMRSSDNSAQESTPKRHRTGEDMSGPSDIAFAYGTEIVVLKTRRESIAHVPLPKFKEYAPHLCGKLESLQAIGHDLQLYTIVFPSTSATIAQGDHDWFDFFYMAYTFSSSNSFVDIRDALVDILISRIRNDETFPVGEPMTKINYYYQKLSVINSTLDSLWAPLIIRHKKPLVFGRDVKYAIGVKDLVTTHLGRFYETRDDNAIPQDPLAPDFADHCSYHRHGSKPCYKTKVPL